MNKIPYMFLFIFIGCHEYDEPLPIQDALPKELNVDVRQVWVRLYADFYGNLIPSIKIPFQYQGAEYELSFSNVTETGANAIIGSSTRNIITATPAFTSVIWSQQHEDEGYSDWGNSFTTFAPYSLTIRSIVLANPGEKLKVPAMLGVENITMSVDPTTAIMIYSQFDLQFDSEAYSKLYVDNPQNLIGNFQATFNALLDYQYLYASIQKTEQ